MAALVNVNGTIVERAKAFVSVFDHGFMFGEGVYETIRTYNRQPFLFDRHMCRLRASAKQINLPCPYTDEDVLSRIIVTMEAAVKSGETYIRLLLTRGEGDITYDPRACPSPSLMIIVKPHLSIPTKVEENGVMVSLSTVMRNHPDSVSPAIKSNNLLNNALAMQQALKNGGYEALMCNYKGDLVECAQSNFFIVQNGIAVTPPLRDGLLEGVTRNFIFEVGNEIGIQVHEASLKRGDLNTATEAFLTSTTREIVPIVKVDQCTIGTGQPGPVTKALLLGLRKKAEILSQP